MTGFVTESGSEFLRDLSKDDNTHGTVEENINIQRTERGGGMLMTRSL